MNNLSSGARPTVQFADVCEHRLEYVDIPALREQQPNLVFLHEGLGSVSMWRDFPARVASGTGCRTIAYSRYGHGRSSKRHQPYTVRFMHDEALNVLPGLRDALSIERPVFIGHSTGGSMALIHAGAGQWDVRGLVVMAPLCFVEEFNLDRIRRAKAAFKSTDMRKRLARYHDDVDAVFWGWNDIWLNPEFKSWSLEDYLPGIKCPVLAILGENDEYSTRRQIELIAERAVNSPRIEQLYLADCGHSPHRDQPERTLEAITRFIESLERWPCFEPKS